MKPNKTIVFSSAFALLAGGGGYGLYAVNERIDALEAKVASQQDRIDDAHWLAGEAMDVAEKSGSAKADDREEGRDGASSGDQPPPGAQRSETGANGSGSPSYPNQGNSSSQKGTQGALKPSDPVLGPGNAPISLVVYTDLECPYCKQLHTSRVIQQLVSQAGGAINATYRAVPLRGHGREAVKEAIAADCARRLAGDQAYFRTVEAIFKATQGNGRGTGQPLDQLTAQASGADQQALHQCMTKREVAQSVLRSRKDAARSGVRQTPSIRVVDNRTGQSQLIGGNKPQQLMKVLGRMVEGGGAPGQLGRGGRR